MPIIYGDAATGGVEAACRARSPGAGHSAHHHPHPGHGRRGVPHHSTVHIVARRGWSTCARNDLGVYEVVQPEFEAG